MMTWRTACIAAVSAALMSQSALAAPLTREDAVELVLETSPRIAEARAQVDAARAGLLRTRSEYLPRVTFNATGGLSDRKAEAEDGNIFSEQSSPTTASIELSHTLYASGQRSLSSGLARLALERAELNLVRVERDVVLETRLAFERTRAALDLLAIEVSTRDAIQAQLAGITARERAGAGTQTDIAQAEARLAEAEAQIATARAERDIAIAELEALTGEPSVSLATTPAPRAAIARNLTDLIDDALLYDPDLQSLALLERQARLQVALSDQRYGPTVSFSASAQRVDDPSPLLDRDDEARAIVSLSVPLFNGGARTADRRAGLAERDRVRFNRLDYQRRLVAQIRSLWASLQAAEAALAAQQRREEAAEAALTGVEEGLEAGLSSTLDVLDSLRELQASRRARASAESAVIQAELNLASFAGHLDLP